ncbi:hypothetical protein HAX54_046781 [Datura stramonium]|uniref:Uncharacterized protein n=1 Tax=Datura stramonium TaxID=4076 RepID=A0ABS8WHJ7_DATST|nr:hypothetical protein [Datura stramonium]
MWENVKVIKWKGWFTISQPTVYWRFVNWISDPPVARRLGSNASAYLCCIGDLPSVHGYASVVRWAIRWSNAQSPSLLPYCDLKR